MSTFFAFRGLQSVAFMKCSAILTKNIAGSSGIELPILFASIESIDTFVSIDDFDTFSIVSPITIEDVDHYRSQVVPHNEDYCPTKLLSQTIGEGGGGGWRWV